MSNIMTVSAFFLLILFVILCRPLLGDAVIYLISNFTDIYPKSSIYIFIEREEEEEREREKI